MKGFSKLDNPNHQGKTNIWLTPWNIINKLGNFNLDPCAYQTHPTADKLIYPPQDGLSSEWFGRVWLNPPYGKEIDLWLRKLERHGRGVALVFSRTDTKWFQNAALKADWIFFLKGRVKFMKPDRSFDTNAGHGSCLIGYGEKWNYSLDGVLMVKP